jgi:hypothetical protein
MPGEQPGERAEDGATASSGAINPGVLEAENIVCGAWEQILLERRDHMESALEAAFVCCDTAYQYLAAPIDSVSAVDDGGQLGLSKDQVRDLPPVELDKQD